MSPRTRRGFTVVELLISLTVFAIGVSGVIAAQHVTVAANQHAKNLAIATSVAQAWQDQLAADATLWTGQTGLANTTWLQAADNNLDWFRPAFDATRNFGAAFDALGNVVTDANVAQAHFCTHVRLTMLYPQAGANGLMRAEIRVFWLRDGGTGTSPVCSPAARVADIGAQPENYHFVYQTSALKQMP